MSIQKSHGILLYKRGIRETSSIAVFYTEDFGKIKGLVKGARGAQAKPGLYLREFGEYEIVFYEKRRTDTYMITQCDLREPYSEIADNLQKRLTAYYVSELVDKFTPLTDKSRDIYGLLGWVLRFIRKERFLDRAKIIFQLKLLQYTGFLPALEACTNCSKEMLRSTSFSIRMGGLLCGDCRRTDMQSIPLSKGSVASINLIRKRAADGLERLTISKDISKELKLLLDRFIAYHLGEHLRAYEFIKEASSKGVI